MTNQWTRDDIPAGFAAPHWPNPWNPGPISGVYPSVGGSVPMTVTAPMPLPIPISIVPPLAVADDDELIGLAKRILEARGYVVIAPEIKEVQ